MQKGINSSDKLFKRGFYVCFYLKVRLNITALSITHTVVIIIILSTCYCICTESSCHRTVSNCFSSNCAPYNWKHCHSIMQGQFVQVFIWLPIFAAVSEQGSLGNSVCSPDNTLVYRPQWICRKRNSTWTFCKFPQSCVCKAPINKSSTVLFIDLICLLRETDHKFNAILRITHTASMWWSVPGEYLVLLKWSGCVLLLTKGGAYFSEPAMLLHTRMMIPFLYIFMRLQFLPLSVYVLSYSK